MAIELLTEQLIPSEANIISESSTDGKNMWLNGVFMSGGHKNRNGRTYPVSELTEAVRLVSNIIKENRGIFGELEHPPHLSVSADRVSHVITELWMNGNNAHGKCKLLNTPCGSIAQELIKSGVRIGVSSRGAGNVNESGEVSAYGLVTVDIVINPSSQYAYPNSIYESLDRSKNGSKIMTLAEAAQHDPVAQKYLKEEILKWVNSCSFK